MRYKIEANSVINKRRELVDTLLAEKEKQIEEEAEEKSKAANEAGKERIAALVEKRKAAETRLSGLSLFKRREKQTERELIAQFEAEIAQEKEQIKKNVRECSDTVNKKREIALKERKSITEEAARQLPMPPKPERPEGLPDWVREYTEAEMREGILRYLRRGTSNLHEIMDNVPELILCSNQTAIGMLQILKNTGRIYRFDTRPASYKLK